MIFMTALVNIQTCYLELNISIYKLCGKGEKILFAFRTQMTWNYQDKIKKNCATLISELFFIIIIFKGIYYTFSNKLSLL